MKQKLTGLEYYKAVIAKWIVVNIATRISSAAVLSLCLEIASIYNETIEANEEVS